MSNITVSILWKAGPSDGSVEVRGGRLAGLRASGGGSTDTFKLAADGDRRLDVTVADVNLGWSADPTAVTIRSNRGAFSFLLRDVVREWPIFLPSFGAVVTEAGDVRSYEQIERDIRSRKLQTVLQRIESEPEETYQKAASATRSQCCPMWLGISRDYRIFELGWSRNNYTIDPKQHSSPIQISETDKTFLSYNYTVGRGTGCREDMPRRLEDGVLPILHYKLHDDDVVYDSIAFATMERSALTLKSLRGTHFLAADGHGIGHMFTEKQQAEFDTLDLKEQNRDEETVLFIRVEAVNKGSVPRYAWFKSIRFRGSRMDADGFGLADDGRVFAVSKLNGAPMPKEEVAILLTPGAKAVFEIRVPHQPISPERAAKLSEQDFDARHKECAEFWKSKLASAAKVRLPEKRLEEMIQAGLLHLDLIAYGLEPDKPVAPCIGVYCPIGSESSPIVQFMDSMGWNGLARRSLTYFLEKQHEDGFMQNYGGYMLETGAALWSMGEHYRYTRDDAWAGQIASKLIIACDYLIAWRNRNMKEDIRGKGYGMLDGKVADPEDPYHIFMLNGYAYMGLSRVSEMLAATMPEESRRLACAAEELKQAVRDSFFESMARSPVVPLSDGTWCPSAPPWAEADSPACLLTDNANWHSHGTVGTRDSLLGPLYLVFQEVIEPEEDASKWLLESTTELLHMRNVAFSQPYYSRHPWVNLRLGQVKAFLKAHYNALASLADRETYTFTEHYFLVSNHKTHEEGWFLLQMRWMLYMEQGDDLKLLPGIPRAWMESGKRIELDGMASYFGPLSLRVESRLDEGFIKAEVKLQPDRKPRRIGIRLPHPEGKKAVEVTGGVYDAATETVWVEPFGGSAVVVARF